MRSLALVIALLTSVAHANLYVWTDAKGVEHYSSTPPDDAPAKKKAKVFKSDTAATGQATGVPNPGPAPAAAAAAPKSGHRVELYTTSWCPHCAEARNYLSSHGIAFQDFDIEKDRAAHARYAGYGGRGIPLAVIDGAPMTGFNAAAYDRLLKP